MIIFATQEDFDNAVMRVLHERLLVSVSTDVVDVGTKLGVTKTEVVLSDILSGNEIDSSFSYA